MIAFPRRFVAFLCAVAAIVLALIVLVTQPDNQVDLLAGGVLAAGVSIVLWLAPAD